MEKVIEFSDNQSLRRLTEALTLVLNDENIDISQKRYQLKSILLQNKEYLSNKKYKLMLERYRNLANEKSRERCERVVQRLLLEFSEVDHFVFSIMVWVAATERKKRYLAVSVPGYSNLPLNYSEN